jgi:hypothetical protein
MIVDYPQLPKTNSAESEVFKRLPVFILCLLSARIHLLPGHSELTGKAQKGSFSQLTAAKLTKENPTGGRPGTTDANQLITALTGPDCLAISTAAPGTAFTAPQTAATHGATARAALMTARWSTAHVEAGAARNIGLRLREWSFCFYFHRYFLHGTVTKKLCTLYFGK